MMGGRKLGKGACPYCGAIPSHQRKTPGVVDIGGGFEVHRECHIVQVEPGWWECDRCGCSINWDDFEQPNCNYCPNCGAKVVEQ